MPIDAPWLVGPAGPNSGDIYVTTTDQNVPDGQQLRVDDYYEIGSGFTTELYGSGGVLSIFSPYFTKQFGQNLPVADQDQLVNQGNEVFYSDVYEINAGIAAELDLNAVLVLGIPTYSGMRSGVDSSGGFLEILTSALS